MKIIGMLALIIAGLFFLAMSACGGIATLELLGEPKMGAMLFISVPSLLIGALGLWRCYKAAANIFRKKKTED